LSTQRLGWLSLSGLLFFAIFTALVIFSVLAVLVLYALLGEDPYFVVFLKGFLFLEEVESSPFLPLKSSDLCNIAQTVVGVLAGLLLDFGLIQPLVLQQRRYFPLPLVFEVQVGLPLELGPTVMHL